MPLTMGTRIGPYEIQASVGAGGMGEVYRARDTKLHRDVALKVLPDLFAGDLDRLARFDREARALASLNVLDEPVLPDTTYTAEAAEHAEDLNPIDFLRAQRALR